MDPRLLRYYNQELRHLREMGGEFAREFPKIAGRLGMEGLEVADPYVERLLEGAAFLAARVQLKQDAEFPQLAQTLLDTVCPNLGAPLPSMLVAQLQPLPDPNLLAGFKLPRGSTLLGPATVLGPMRCEFRTSQDTILTPLSVGKVEYFMNAPDLGLATLPVKERVRSGVRIQLQLPAGMSFKQLRLPQLRFFLGGLQDVALRFHSLISADCIGAVVGVAGARQFVEPEQVRMTGFEDEEALLPVTQRGLSGTRLMQEYFAFPQRFLFTEVSGLAPAFANVTGNQCELVLLFKRHDAQLEGSGEPANFALHCVPAINLFERHAERITVDDRSAAFHVVPDRLHGHQLEVFDISSLAGFAPGSDELEFLPLFALPQRDAAKAAGFFTTTREPRLASEQVKREGPRSAYVGTEVFVQLVDLKRAPYRSELRELAAKVRITQRDLPLFMPLTGPQAGMSLEGRAPVKDIQVVAGPSRPVSSQREGPVAWRLLNLLSLNHLSLADTNPTEGALALRELLSLFAQGADAGLQRQVEGLRSVALKPVVRRHPAPGPIAFGRGLQIDVSVDELNFEGGSPLLLGAVLHRYFSRHVSMNSFVQTAVHSQSRGELQRWAPLGGNRALL
jgi:type VI secretion system protein ImpG